MLSASTNSEVSIYRLAAGGLIAMAVAMGFGRFVYTPLLPDLMEGLHLSPSQAGFIASSNYLGYLVGAILAAYGWAEGKERLIVVSGLVATTLLLLAIPFANDFLLLSIIRFAAGIASAFVMVFGATIVFSHFDAAGAMICRRFTLVVLVSVWRCLRQWSLHWWPIRPTGNRAGSVPVGLR